MVTIGNFDGVHRGHQAIFARVVTAATHSHGTPAVLTFDPHPAKVLAPEHPLQLIQTLPQRCATIAACGIALIVVEPFTKALATMTPEAFFTEIVCHRLGARQLIVGYDFTFGNHRSGRVEHLQTLGQMHGVAVDIVEPFFDGEILLSSSYVRQCVREGRLEAAASALGRPYEMTGAVVRGRGIGTQIGYPTINTVPANELIPPEGVYVSTATWGTTAHAAATYIGRNPTFGGTTLVVETYLLRFSEAITATTMDVAFHTRLRGDIRFDTPEALQTQIAKDVDVAKKYHAAAS